LDPSKTETDLLNELFFHLRNVYAYRKRGEDSYNGATEPVEYEQEQVISRTAQVMIFFKPRGVVVEEKAVHEEVKTRWVEEERSQKSPDLKSFNISLRNHLMILIFT
jgi:hypothetical protein